MNEDLETFLGEAGIGTRVALGKCRMCRKPIFPDDNWKRRGMVIIRTSGRRGVDGDYELEAVCDRCRVYMKMSISYYKTKSRIGDVPGTTWEEGNR